MQVVLTCLLIMGGTSTVAAHNPLSARYHFEAGSLASELTINLSQDGLNKALLEHHERQILEELSRQSFKELIVAYVKDNINLSINGRSLKLGAGGIKLGDHQTDLRFVLPAFRESIDEIDVNISAFRENDQHQTVFSYEVEGKTGHVILQESNDYDTTIVLHASGDNSIFYLLALAGGITLLLGGLLLYRNNFRIGSINGTPVIHQTS